MGCFSFFPTWPNIALVPARKPLINSCFGLLHTSCETTSVPGCVGRPIHLACWANPFLCPPVKSVGERVLESHCCVASQGSLMPTRNCRAHDIGDCIMVKK